MYRMSLVYPILKGEKRNSTVYGSTPYSLEEVVVTFNSFSNRAIGFERQCTFREHLLQKDKRFLNMAHTLKWVREQSSSFCADKRFVQSHHRIIANRRAIR
jgi:hypothetical protein